jgi:hypothetical protein
MISGRGDYSLALGMKKLYKKASHLRAHTWRDIGGMGGLLLDWAFFVFLFFTSAIVLVLGMVVVVLDYVFSPALALVSACRGPKAKFIDDTILLDDGTLGTRPSGIHATTQSESLSAAKA